MEPLATKEEFIKLRAQGFSFDKIAKKLKKARQTLVDWSKELEEEIANRRALELEALYDAHAISKEHRIKSFAEVLQKVRQELASRDLSDVPTDKLLDLFLKFTKEVEGEIIEPRFSDSQQIIEAKEERQLLSGGIDLGRLTEQELATLEALQRKLSTGPDTELKAG